MIRAVVLGTMLLWLVGCGPSVSGTDGGALCGTSSATPANLMFNGGSFECGTNPLDGWTAVAGVMSLEAGGHLGSSAVKVVADASGSGSIGTAKAVVASTSGGTYCATVWAKGTTPDMRLEVLAVPNGIATSFGSPIASTEWIRVPPSTNLEVRVPKGQELYVRLRTHNGRPGDTLILDDVDVWESPDERCRER